MPRDRSEVSAALEEILDELAAIEHERWAHWQAFLHAQGERMPDGSLLIPEKDVERWERQIATPFSELSPAEKDSDRDQVRRYLPRIVAALTAR